MKPFIYSPQPACDDRCSPVRMHISTSAHNVRARCTRNLCMRMSEYSTSAHEQSTRAREYATHTCEDFVNTCE